MPLKTQRALRPPHAINPLREGRVAFEDAKAESECANGNKEGLLFHYICSKFWLKKSVFGSKMS